MINTAQMATYLNAIIADYESFQMDCKNRANASMAAYYDETIAKFKRDIKCVVGKKYIKIVRMGSGVHSFIVVADMQESNGHVWRKGDILKAATYAAPAKNFARGNIITGSFPTVTWTGA